jgi:hypothetical protein
MVRLCSCGFATNDYDWLACHLIDHPEHRGRSQLSPGSRYQARATRLDERSPPLPMREPEYLDVPSVAAMDDPCVLHRVHTGLKNL